MGWKTDQFVPAADVVRKVIDEAIVPAVAAAFDRLRLVPPSCDVTVWEGYEQRPEPYISKENPGSNQKLVRAHIRLRFRRTFKPERALFFAQLLTDKPSEANGLAGLLVRGDLKSNAGITVVKTTSCSAIYNHSNWIDPSYL